MKPRTAVQRGLSALLTLSLLAMIMVGVSGAHAATPLDTNVTTPRDFFGYDIGQDYKITPWETHTLQGEGSRQGIVEYMHELSNTSARVHIVDEGLSSQSRPMILTVVTSPDNWSQIATLKGILKKLADPRQVASDDEAKLLASQGKPVYWMSAGIHSTERTSPEVLMRLAYHLASNNDAWTLNLLDNAIVIMENCINPDGLDMVTDWYYQYRISYPRSNAPYYGKYVNHDDNRDFIGGGLLESQNNVRMRTEWSPTVYHDLHEAQNMLFMSPNPDPTNEAVSPITSAEWLAFAGHNISQLVAEGWQGVFTYKYSADMWYPGYNHGYSFMHNSHGRFYEMQGASNLANPASITSPSDSPRTWFDPAPTTASRTNPLSWHLLDAVNLEEDALKNDLTYTVSNKEMLLYNFYMKAKSNMQTAESTAPYAFVIPADGGDNADVTDMINNLVGFQHIEVDRASAPFTVNGQQYQIGDYVVQMHQPYALTAKNLLGIQTFPPIKTPYDVTAWTYGLMRDVRVDAVTATLPAGISVIPVAAPVPYAGTLTGGVSATGHYVIEHQSNNNLALVLPQLWSNPEFEVAQADASFSAGGRAFPPGTFLVHTVGTPATDYDTLKTLVESNGLVGYSVTEDVPGTRLVQPSIAVYGANSSTGTTMPEGWTRLRLDDAHWSYTRIHGTDIQTPTVPITTYNVIVIPPMSVNTLITSSSGTNMPPEYRPGIGNVGVDRLKGWVQAGGTLILQGSATRLPIDKSWGISVTIPAAARAAPIPEDVNPADIPDFGGQAPPEAALTAPDAPTALNCPGAILRLAVDPTTKVGYGYDSQESTWCTGTPYFDVAADSRAAVVASYPNDGRTLLQSGYVSGDSALYGKAAIVDAPLGAGHVILLSPDVVYRAQATGSYMFLWNALFEGARVTAP